MKVVFASDGSGGTFPVIAEEITVSMKEIPSCNTILAMSTSNTWIQIVFCFSYSLKTIVPSTE